MRSKVILLTAVAAAIATVPAHSDETWTVAKPSTFSGTIPCADCEGIRQTLDLTPDGAFISRLEYIGRDRRSVSVGRWQVNGGRLVLSGGREATQYFRIADADTLRKLDGDGREIEATMPYEIRREPVYRLIGDPLRLTALFRAAADAGRAVLCLTGQDVSIAPEGESGALLAEYAKARTAPGSPVLVTFVGRFVERPRADGAGTELGMVVDRFDQASPGETCSPPAPQN